MSEFYDESGVVANEIDTESLVDSVPDILDDENNEQHHPYGSYYLPDGDVNIYLSRNELRLGNHTMKERFIYYLYYPTHIFTSIKVWIIKKIRNHLKND